MPIDYSDPLALIKAEEGFAPKAKWDYRQYSGGYGSRAAPGEVFTPAKAESYLRRDAAPVIDWVNRLVPNATPQQRAALVSFGYNLGTDDLDKLRTDIQAGDWGRVATRMRSFNRAGGEVLPGLVSRRAREAALIGGAPADPASMMAQSLRQRFGTRTEGGVTPQTQPAAGGAGIDRLKSALTKSYDPDRLTDAESLTASGQRIAGTSGNALGAIGGSILAGIGGYQRNQERDARKAHDAEFSRLAGDASSTEGLMNVMLGSSDPAMRSAGIELKAKLLTPKSEEWVSAGDGFVMNKATGETRAIDGFSKPSTPVEVNGRLVQRQPDGSFKEVYAAPQKARNLTVTEQKEVFEADEGAHAATNVIGSLGKAIDLNDKAYSGPAAQTRGYLTSLVGAEGGAATEELQNVVLQQVLDNLKATFGAAPTEGERQILVDIQGSVNKAPAVRKRIFESAMAAAERRRTFNQNKAAAIRGGEYFQPGFSPAQQGASGGAPVPASSGNPDAPTPVRTQTIDPASGQPRPAPSSSATAPQPAAPPSGAVTKLLQNPTPEMQSFFDQKYGQGTAARLIEEQRSRPAATPTPDPLQQQPNSIGAF